MISRLLKSFNVENSSLVGFIGRFCTSFLRFEFLFVIKSFDSFELLFVSLAVVAVLITLLLVLLLVLMVDEKEDGGDSDEDSFNSCISLSMSF